MFPSVGEESNFPPLSHCTLTLKRWRPPQLCVLLLPSQLVSNMLLSSNSRIYLLNSMKLMRSIIKYIVKKKNRRYSVYSSSCLLCATSTEHGVHSNTDFINLIYFYMNCWSNEYRAERISKWSHYFFFMFLDLNQGWYREHSLTWIKVYMSHHSFA